VIGRLLKSPPPQHMPQPNLHSNSQSWRSPPSPQHQQQHHTHHNSYGEYGYAPSFSPFKIDCRWLVVPQTLTCHVCASAIRMYFLRTLGKTWRK
jgi:hypothetical protein